MKLQYLFEQVLSEFEDNRQAAQHALDAVIRKYDALGMSCWIYLKGDYGLEIASIKVTDKTKRRQGLGGALMVELMSLCDEFNLIGALTPSDSESSMAGLIRFYKQFGFVNNTGRHKDFRFRNSMIREPKYTGELV